MTDHKINKTPETLRSARWFAPDDLRAFGHRSRAMQMAGGFPIELPALSLSESLLKPTTMLYRNLLAMDAEELLRGHPVDGVVLMGGCDKTTPALLLGATSMNIPAIY